MTPSTPQIPRDVAAQILDRAARIDAGDDHMDLTSLRSAATDAGIQPEAFDRAVAEMIARPQSPIAPPSTERGGGYELAAKAFGIGVAAGTLAIAAVSIIAGGPPPQTALLGAVIGGGGALAGVVAYLINRRR